MLAHCHAVSVGVGKTVDYFYGFVVEVHQNCHSRAGDVGVGVVGVETGGKSVCVHLAAAGVTTHHYAVQVVARQTVDLSVCQIDAVRFVKLGRAFFDAGNAGVKTGNVAERADAVDVDVAVFVLKNRLIVNGSGGGIVASRILRISVLLVIVTTPISLSGR